MKTPDLTEWHKKMAITLNLLTTHRIIVSGPDVYVDVYRTELRYSVWAQRIDDATVAVDFQVIITYPLFESERERAVISAVNFMCKLADELLATEPA